MFNGSVGPLELVIVLVIVLLIFGPKRLPGLGRQLGRGMREFKDSITGSDKDDEAKTGQRPEVAQAAATPTQPPATEDAARESQAAAAEALGGEQRQGGAT